ncbi:MAG: hypothetical protein AB1756_04670 [Acidobacteriota bacterium]
MAECDSFKIAYFNEIVQLADQRFGEPEEGSSDLPVSWEGDCEPGTTYDLDFLEEGGRTPSRIATKWTTNKFMIRNLSHSAGRGEYWIVPLAPITRQPMMASGHLIMRVSRPMGCKAAAVHVFFIGRRFLIFLLIF